MSPVGFVFVTTQADHAVGLAHSGTTALNAVGHTPFSNASRALSPAGNAIILPQQSQQHEHLTLLASLPTPVNVQKLRQVLKGYNPIASSLLIAGFSEGFKINFQGTPNVIMSRNLTSAFEQPQVVDEKLVKEIKEGRIAGPYDFPPLPNMQISPVGVVPKKVKGEFRMIQNLSSPYGQSINDGIPKEYTSVHYASVDDAVRIIKQLGIGCVMAKTDIKSAFRIVTVHPHDYHLLGFRWKGKYYYDCCLPMGCASSCKMFEEFTTALEWVARHKLGIRQVIHILDDFLIIDRSLPDCKANLKKYVQRARSSHSQ